MWDLSAAPRSLRRGDPASFSAHVSYDSSLSRTALAVQHRPGTSGGGLLTRPATRDANNGTDYNELYADEPFQYGSYDE